MKLLTLLSKKSPFTNRTNIFLFSFLILFIGIAASCRMHMSAADQPPVEEEETNEGWFSSLMDNFSSKKTDQFIPVFKTAQGNDKFLVAKLSKSACIKESKAPATLKWRVNILSPFGDSVANIETNWHGFPQKAIVSIAKEKFEIVLTEPVSQKWLENACKSDEFENDSPSFSAPPHLEGLIKTWLVNIAPDCAFDGASAAGWQCTLPTADAAHTQKELSSIKSKMIRRWSRQPYLLARRLAVTSSLAKALKSSDKDAAFNKFCKVVKYSLPQEMPAVFGSSRWQQVICSPQNKHRDRAAGFGLAKGFSEITFLKELFEKTSKLGYLVVKIPRESIPKKTLWISLHPDDDVRQNIVAETTKLNSSGKSHDPNLARQKACWHPVFGETSKLLSLSRHLHLAGNTMNTICLDSNKPENDQTSFRYLADSITSETEFVISNGRGKMLRLPYGNYSYTVKGLPKNPNEWDEASENAPQSTGKIFWSKKRPRPIIKKW